VDRDGSPAGAGPGRIDQHLRARDVDRPTPEDLAAAEQDVVIVRRHWTPPAQPGRDGHN
jgi:hypothetical protein